MKPIGIIPANTGRIIREGEQWHRSRDHPREYGENQWRRRRRLPWVGSSPRIRGELGAQYGLLPGVGIIPANTGRIPRQAVACARIPDHPREYGENDEAGS